MNELKVKLSKYGQFPRYELISMGLLPPIDYSRTLNNEGTSFTRRSS